VIENKEYGVDRLQHFDSTLAARIDHTALKADVTPDDIRALCEEARLYGFASVCVNPSFVSAAAGLLGLDVPVCTVIGFPLGATSTQAKMDELRQAAADGAREFDMVIHIGMLKSGRFTYVANEIRALTDLVHSLDPHHLLKVIIETAMLTDDEKRQAAHLVSSSGADFIKTSTGFGGGGATASDIALLRSECAATVRVKASGGIRTREDALALIDAGADRIGASSSVAIIRQ
jgi:deoxyribose-phosphate aldolase